MKYLQGLMFLPKSDHKLSTVQTFKDNDGLLRLKTKILEINDSYLFLCPIVLDYKYEAITLLIRETHENLCHAGVQIVMSQLREKFWIFSMRKIVKSVIDKCVVCKRFDVKCVKADPPSLPVDRVKDASVFEITGIGYAGSVFLREKQKGLIYLFTCAIYRAVHLEILTSEFLGCLRRFIVRRGKPKIVYSDNGKKFVGANNAFDKLNWDVISKYSSAKQIDWRFNPPSAAWWGVWWE